MKVNLVCLHSYQNSLRTPSKIKVIDVVQTYINEYFRHSNLIFNSYIPLSSLLNASNCHPIYHNFH